MHTLSWNEDETMINSEPCLAQQPGVCERKAVGVGTATKLTCKKSFLSHSSGAQCGHKKAQSRMMAEQRALPLRTEHNMMLVSAKDMEQVKPNDNDSMCKNENSACKG